MSIIHLLVILVVIGVLLYLVNSVLPIAAPIKTIINVVVVLFVCIWLLEVFGLFSGPVFGGGPLNQRIR
jgi:hypothetical protein